VKLCVVALQPHSLLPYFLWRSHLRFGNLRVRPSCYHQVETENKTIVMFSGCGCSAAFLPVRILKNSLSASQNLWPDLGYMQETVYRKTWFAPPFFFLFLLYLPDLKLKPLGRWNNPYLSRQLSAGVHQKTPDLQTKNPTLILAHKLK